jgi:hypothetical protein
MMRACLVALSAAALFLPVTGLAQQQLVQPQRVQPQPAQPRAPDWFESNRAMQVIQAQERPHPGGGAPGGLAGVEAGQVYGNFIQGIGKPLQSLSGNKSYGPPSDFGGGSGSSSGGQQ